MRVKRHLKGKVFSRMGEELRKEYARVLQGSPDALAPFRPEVLEGETYELPPGLSTEDREAGQESPGQNRKTEKRMEGATS
jgi:hypothetical protein